MSIIARPLRFGAIAALAAAGLLALPGSAPGRAAPAGVPLVVDRWGGATTGVAVDGDRAYVAVGASLAAVDVSDPSAMVELARSAPERDVLTHLHVVGGYVVALGWTIGLVSFDVLDPVVPTAVGRVATLGNATDLAVEGERAYVCDTKGGLQIIDLHDPARPVIVGEWLPPDGYSAAQVAVAGSRAYVVLGEIDSQLSSFFVSANARLAVVDVADAAQPELVASVDLQVPPEESYATDVAVKDDHVFVGVNNGLLVVDAGDPARMTVEGPIEVGAESSLAVEGDHLWTYSRSQQIYLHDIAGPDPFANLQAVPWDTWIEVSRDGIGGVAESGGHAYVATGAALEVIDLGQPFFDATLGKVILVPGPATDPTAPSLGGVAVYADTFVLVAAQRHGLQIVEGFDPRAPEKVTALPPAVGDNGRTPATQHVAVDGTRAYLAEAGLGGGLRIVDLIDPGAPVVLGQVEAPGNAGQPVVVGHHVLVPVGPGDSGDSAASGIRVYDVQVPSMPREVAWLPIELTWQGWPTSVSLAVAGDVAVAIGDSVVVVDFGDPTAPRRRGEVDSLRIVGGGGLATDGRWAYVAGGQAGLAVIDLADPDRPRLVTRLMYVDGWQALRLDADTLLAATGREITALDVSTRDRPRVAATWGRSHGATTFAVLGTTIWAAGVDGLLVAIDSTAPSGLRTLGELSFEGEVMAASMDGDRVVAMTNYPWRRPLVTVFGGRPRPNILGQSFSTEMDHVLHATTTSCTALRGDRLWLTGVEPGLAAFDVSDPNALHRLTPTDGEPIAIGDDCALVGDRMYAHVILPGDHPSRIGIYDVADPAAPRLLGAVTRQWWARAFAVDGRTLWALDYGDPDASEVERLVAYDVVDPAAPHPIAAHPFQFDTVGTHVYYRNYMAADAGTLLITDDVSGVSLWDVSSPAEAHPVGQIDLHGVPVGVAVDDGFAWVTVQSDRLRVAVIDVHDPAAPVEVGSINLADPSGAGISVSGRSAAIANGPGGLFVVRLPDPGEPPPDATPQPIGRNRGAPPTAWPSRTAPPTRTPSRPVSAPLYLPLVHRQARLGGPPPHIVVAIDRSAAMGHALVAGSDGPAPPPTRFDAAIDFAAAVAVGAAALDLAPAGRGADGPTVSVVTYGAQAERLAVGEPTVLRRWLAARPPTDAAAPRHDVGLAAASADLAAVGPAACPIVVLVAARGLGARVGGSGADGDGPRAASEDDAIARAALLRERGVRTVVVAFGAGDDARTGFALLAGGAAAVLQLDDPSDVARLAADLVGRLVDCAP